MPLINLAGAISQSRRPRRHLFKAGSAPLRLPLTRHATERASLRKDSAGSSCHRGSLLRRRTQRTVKGSHANDEDHRKPEQEIRPSNKTIREPIAPGGGQLVQRQQGEAETDGKISRACNNDQNKHGANPNSADRMSDRSGKEPLRHNACEAVSGSIQTRIHWWYP